jgi:hypothetical protein
VVVVSKISVARIKVIGGTVMCAVIARDVFEGGPVKI